MTAVIETTEQGLALKGDFVYETVPDLVQVGEAALKDSSASELIINCSEVNRMDSAGVSLLLEWMRVGSESNQSIKLEAFPAQAKSLLETLKLNELFKFV